MKLYQKKSASLEDETVLVQLERRHTLKEDTNEADTDNPRKTIRANSLGNFGEGPSSSDVEAVSVEKKSNFTRKPTIITESELSSSWLYKDRKAKINSDDESVENPGTATSHDDLEDLEPRALQDPTLQPAPVSNQRHRKMSSCCLYFTIILVICVACLAIMAGVGGIVYMEFFTSYKEDTENTNASVKNDPSLSKETFHHSTDEQDNFYRHEPKIPEDILKDIIKNSTTLAEKSDASEKLTVVTSQPNEDIYPIKYMKDSKYKKSTEFKIKGNFISGDQDIEIGKHPKMAERSDVSRSILSRFNHFKVPISVKSVEIKSNANNHDSLDANLNLQSIDDTKHEIANGQVNMVNEKMTGNGSIVTEKSNAKEVLDFGDETSLSEKDFIFDETTTLQGIELIGEPVNVDISFENLPEFRFLPFDNSQGHVKNFISDHEDSSVNHRKYDIDHDSEENSLDRTKHSIDLSPKDISLDHTEHSNDHSLLTNSLDNTEYSNDYSLLSNSLDHTEHSIDPNDKSLNDRNEDSSDSGSDDSSSDELPLVDDQNQNSDDSTQLVFIRPIVESKAIPVSLAFLRRIGFDIKNPNSRQPMTANDMDIKFSLSEALKYLRSLDTENKLPVSREKTTTRKKSDQTESKKTKLPIKSESEEYLNLLRKHIFEKKS